MPWHDEAIRDERERIAREIHDVLGHHLTVLAIHAAATERLIGLPAPAHAALELIRCGATDALRDLRVVLDSLDHDGGVDGGATLDDLEALVDGVSTAGLAIELTRGGRPLPVDREVSQTALRIVQEALTNSLRHGRATDGRVALTYDGDSLTVEVVDNGVGPVTKPPSGRTHRGLRGMHQRVAKVCGDLQVGPVPDGGFRVWARLPRLAPAGRAQA